MLEDNDDVVFEKDEDLKGTEDKIGELLKSKERTPEQEQELTDLKKHRQGRYNERLNEFKKSERQASERAARAEARAEELQRQMDEREKATERQPRSGSYEQVTINGKSFYTDEALERMVQDGKMTQADAWKQQRAAIKAEAVEEAKVGLKEETQKSEYERVKEETIKDVLKEYPQFNPQHKDHNPDDPVYKEASRLLANGYGNNPRGIRLAIDDAKKILRVGEKRPDLSEELSVGRNGNAPDSSKTKTVVLDDYQQESAYRMYVLTGKINPTTNKVYTRQEAIQKAMKAQQSRNAELAGKR